jgi:hypothetical protein
MRITVGGKRSIVVIRRSLALIGLLALAAPAGAKLPVPSPFMSSTGDCSLPTDVSADMAPPTAYYSLARSCPAVCRKAEGDCEQYVKFAGLCNKNAIGDDLSYYKASCLAMKSTPANLKTCFANAAELAKESLATLRDNQATAIAQCKSWGQTCSSTCP